MEINYDSRISEIKKQFSDLDKQKEQKSSKEKREEILKRIYNPRESKESFRILPPKDRKRNFYEIAYFHQIQINGAGGNKKWGKIYCPRHNNPKVKKLDSDGNPVLQENGEPILVPDHCPLCEKHDRIMAKQHDSVRYKKRDELLNESDKKLWDENKKIFTLAKNYEAKKFYIIKGIDKWKPHEGPKFWRIKHSFTNRGVMDKLKSVLEEYVDVYNKDFMSPIDGTDLSVIMGDAKTPAGRPYRDVSAITTKPPSPLHEETRIAKAWLDDETTWRDVFKPKKAPNIEPNQYLEMLAEGNDPYYDEFNKQWVFPNNPELEALANKKYNNLNAGEKPIEQASDLDQNIESKDDYDVTIDNVKKEDVGEFTDDAVDLSKEYTSKEDDSEEKKEDKKITSDDIEEDDLYGDDYDDLPF